MGKHALFSSARGGYEAEKNQGKSEKNRKNFIFFSELGSCSGFSNDFSVFGVEFRNAKNTPAEAKILWF